MSLQYEGSHGENATSESRVFKMRTREMGIEEWVKTMEAGGRTNENKGKARGKKRKDRYHQPLAGTCIQP